MTFYKQIKFQLPFFMILLLVVPVLVSAFLSYSNTAIIERAIIEKDELEALGPRYEAIFDEYEQLIAQLSEREDYQLNVTGTPVDDTINHAQLPLGNEPALTSYYNEVLSEIADEDAFILNLYIGSADGALYLNDIPDVDLTGYDPRTTDWYTQATEAGATIWTSPYIDTATGEPVITVARPIQSSTGAVIGVAGLDFDMANLAGMVRRDVLRDSIITAVVAVIIGLIVVFYFVRNINVNLKTIKNEMQDVANGNLTTTEVKVKGDNEFKALADTVNQMKTSLRQMVLRVKEATENVSKQSGTLTLASGQVSEGSEQIAATMEELSSGSESQANAASDLAQTMERFTQYVGKATHNSEQIEDTSRDVDQMSRDGAVKVSDSVAQMQTIDRIVKDAYEKVKGLDQKANEIGSIVQVIQEISEQTNLLALNAAIEAARAGEEGRGFAVVANEVRKLAEQVGSSVKDITDLIFAIQGESTTVLTSLESGYDAVEVGSKQIEDTGLAFNTIKESITAMVENITKVAGDLTDIKNETGVMQKAIDDIAAVSEESAAAVEETAASAEETSTSMEEVSLSAEALNKLSSDLEEEISRFSL